MAITLDSLLNLEPTKVSRDLTGYITYLYGAAKVGKTTMAKDMGALIVACEDGTRAMSGAYAQIVQSWSEIKTIARLLKDPKMKERYKSIAIDTIDIAATLCEKYICNQYDVEALNKLPYGQGWTLFKKEFEEVFRSIALQGYAVLFISHDKEKTITRQDGTEYNKIVPTVSDTINNIIKNMSDIIAYGYQVPGTEDRYMILRSDGSVDAGTRFPYMESKIPFGYQSLVDALNRAIDKEAEMHGEDAVTSERIKVPEAPSFDFDALMKEFNDIVCNIPGFTDKAQETEEGKMFATYWSPRITEKVEKHLGPGAKVSQCRRNQVEQLSLIVDELREMVKFKDML